MSTNYYVETTGCANNCGHCAQAVKIHLGKSSVGWQFAFRGYELERMTDVITWPVVDYPSWLHLLDLGRIVDEYGRECPRSELLELIRNKQGLRSHKEYGAGPGEYDFLFFEFS